MHIPLSLDLRTRVAEAVAQAATVRAAAARFSVSPATAARLGRRLREGTGLVPGRPGKPRAAIIVGAVADWVRARVGNSSPSTQSSVFIVVFGYLEIAKSLALMQYATAAFTSRSRTAVAAFSTYPATGSSWKT